MTRVLKAIPTLLTAFGASLPTATKDHRGQFVWKRSSGSEDEIHAGVVDSSNVAQFRRILTKTYADTLYAPIVVPGIPTYLNPTVSDSAVDASNTDNTTYKVNVTQSVVLPTGTYTVYAEAGGCFAHSDVNGSVRIHLQVGSDLGTARIVACAQNTGRTELTLANRATGQSGTISVSLEYRPNGSGKTAYAGGGWIQVWYVKE